MYTTSSLNQNPLLQNSFLKSELFDPNFLFKLLVVAFNSIFSKEVFSVVYTILSILAIIFIAVITYSTIRIFEVRKKDHAFLHHEIEEYAHHQALKEKELQSASEFKNIRWKKVLDYLFSSNENDWKLAIIESDLMLFDLLNQIGVQGESLGDKLKNVSLTVFKDLNLAWEAHNIRNKIAHEGSTFELSLHEAKRVIGLYEAIFKDFNFI